MARSADARRISIPLVTERAVVIVGSAIAFGEDMGFQKMLGCSIAIGGTFLYASLT